MVDIVVEMAVVVSVELLVTVDKLEAEVTVLVREVVVTTEEEVVEIELGVVGLDVVELRVAVRSVIG